MQASGSGSDHNATVCCQQKTSASEREPTRTQAGAALRLGGPAEHGLRSRVPGQATGSADVVVGSPSLSPPVAIGSLEAPSRASMLIPSSISHALLCELSTCCNDSGVPESSVDTAQLVNNVLSLLASKPSCSHPPVSWQLLWTIVAPEAHYHNEHFNSVSNHSIP